MRRSDVAELAGYTFGQPAVCAVPPGASKSKDTRTLDIHEDDRLDEAQFAAWVSERPIARRAHVGG